MMLRFLVLWGLVGFACASPAAPLKLDALKVGSRTYSNVTVVGVNTTDLYFTYDRGITNVKLKDLEPKLQKRFDYDPVAAAEAERQQEAQDTLYAAAIASKAAEEAEKAARAARQAAITSPESLADPVSEKSLLGKPAPALEVEKWLGQKPVLQGKFVLIAFWAPWSLPSKKCIPEWNGLQKAFAEKLAVVGLSSEPESAIQEMAEPKIEFASAIDTRARLAAAAGATSVPYVLLEDPKGIVRYQGHPGAINEQKLQSLMAKSAD